jgi:hypothetical protein
MIVFCGLPPEISRQHTAWMFVIQKEQFYGIVKQQ